MSSSAQDKPEKPRVVAACLKRQDQKSPILICLLDAGKSIRLTEWVATPLFFSRPSLSNLLELYSYVSFVFGR